MSTWRGGSPFLRQMACARVTRLIAERVPDSHPHGETFSLFLSAHVSFPSCGSHPVLKTQVVQEACQATLPSPHAVTVAISHPGRQCPETNYHTEREFSSLCYHSNEITGTFTPAESGHATVEVLLRKLKRFLQLTLQGESHCEYTRHCSVQWARGVAGETQAVEFPLLLKMDERPFFFLLFAII